MADILRFDRACLQKISLPDGFVLTSGKPDGIAKLEAQCFSDPWSEESVLSHIHSDSGLALSILHGEDTVAYLLASLVFGAGEGELYRICVDHDHRRLGLGNALMRALDAVSREVGVRDLYLEVRASNAPAINCYQKSMWETVGTRKNYYKNPTEDAVLMHKTLFSN